MVDRFLVWMCAVLLTTGIAVGSLIGAGAALADEDAPSEAGASSSADANSESPANKPDDDPGPTVDGDSDDAPEDRDADALEDRDADALEDRDADAADDAEGPQDADDAPIVDESEIEAEDERRDDDGSALTRETTPPQTLKQPEVEVTTVDDPPTDTEPAEVEVEESNDPEPVEQPEPIEEVEGADTPFEFAATPHEVPGSGVTVQTFAIAAPEPPTAQPTLINVIGSFFFSLFDAVAKFIDGPLMQPANGNVRVGRSNLQIDCGDGYVAETDWYVPTSQEPPRGVIYLQHGFGARGSFYNVTAAKLAEQTNSIVVTPTITSDFFACDACHLTGEPMHFAVAKLWSGDRAALNASLAAAFPDDDIVLPRKYVLAGHSGGSSFAAGVAGYASQLAGPSGSPDLAGVILYDTNDIGTFVSRGIGKVPLATPVYYIGADPTLINNFDDVSAVMKKLRPNQFTGVHLIGGVHTDALESANPLIQIGTSLALGAPKPQNVAAANLLAAGWINDMLSDGVDTGQYATPGAAFDVETDAGTAQAVALGGPLYQPSFLERLISLFYGQMNNLRFGYCAADVDALLAEELEQQQTIAMSSGRAGWRTASHCG